MNLEFFMALMIPMTVYGLLTSVFKTNTILMYTVLLVDIIGVGLLIKSSKTFIEHTSILYGWFYGVLFYVFLKTSWTIITTKIKEL